MFSRIHIAWKYMVYSINTPIKKEEQRCTYAKNVGIQPVNLKFITFTLRKIIHIPQLYWNSMIKGILNLQIHNLQIIC